jgi:hypothetical protein
MGVVYGLVNGWQVRKRWTIRQAWVPIQGGGISSFSMNNDFMSLDDEKVRNADRQLAIGF